MTDGSILRAPRTGRFQPGDLLLDRFRVVRLLGRGGMGEVYLADDLQLGRIALKALRPDIAGTPGTYERFRREVQLARKVGGPQVCRIHELFFLPAAGPDPATAFLTMEYLDGLTLATRLEQGGPVPQKDALSIALDICEGLRLMHEQGIVHRDLKCANVMLCTRAGAQRAVLMDFGLAFDGAREAQAADDTTVSVVATAAGVIAGTPAYMPPEQFEGGPVTAASDIYALGVVLYEMLTDLQPYSANTPMGAAIRRARRPAPVSSLQRSIPRHWDRVIEQCLEYEPHDRFASVEEVATALRANRWHPKNLAIDRPWLLRVVAALLVVAAAWGSVALWHIWKYNRPNAEGARWYQAGVASLREGSYLRAKNELENASRADSRFAMAHARLAEAWFHLDFDGAAQREMNMASEEQSYLRPQDQLYLAAIGSTVTEDTAGAVARYRKILESSPEGEKSAGYVDLGMAYERAGDPQHALEDLAKAETRNPDNPAAFLQAAILETRLNRTQDADRDFDRAESIYRAEMNSEGLAELDYQRGYEANDREANDEANTYLTRALTEAQQLPSVQLEIRALTQLSSLAYNSDHDTEAVDLAQKAIRLAQDNQLSAWAADGLVRLANAEIDERDHPRAEDALDEAFAILKQDQQDRVQALANLTLANLRDQEGRPDDVVAPAQEARAWYKANGYFAEGARAWILIGRAQRKKGDTQGALATGNELLALAEHAGKPSLVTQANELLGSTHFDREDYSHALSSYQGALAAAGNSGNRMYETLHCAQVLAILGKFDDSEEHLESVSASNSLAGQIAGQIRVESLLMQRKYRGADSLARAINAKYPDMSQSRAAHLTEDRAIAQAFGRNRSAALAYVHNELDKDAAAGNSGSTASDELTAATIDLAAGRPREALEAASKAETWFESNALRDSQLRSSLIAMSAAKKMGDTEDYRKYSAKVVDIQTVLQQTWLPALYRSYISRPDIAILLRDAPHPKN